MLPNAFPTAQMLYANGFPRGSQWSRDAEYRSLVASGAGYASVINAERDAAGRFKRRTIQRPEPASPDWWMAL